MKILTDKCIGCGNCAPWCPVGAIVVKDKKAEIIWDECVECNTCYRVGICPVGAIYQQPLEWPRSVRAVYSDPLGVHAETGIAGRGTEETKTNDVTGRFKRGEIGFAIEVGRPNTATRFSDLEKFTKVLTLTGIKFERLNPLTALINPETGELSRDIVNEKVISAIIEFAVAEEKILDIIKIIKDVSETIETVISVDVAGRATEDGKWPMDKYLDEAGIYYRPNAKVNVGLGKPLVL